MTDAIVLQWGGPADTIPFRKRFLIDAFANTSLGRPTLPMLSIVAAIWLRAIADINQRAI
ncbi:MAG: hypothetical protein Rhob2KO_33710 [Rhodopirellula baltica]